MNTGKKRRELIPVKENQGVKIRVFHATTIEICKEVSSQENRSRYIWNTSSLITSPSWASPSHRIRMRCRMLNGEPTPTLFMMRPLLVDAIDVRYFFVNCHQWEMGRARMGEMALCIIVQNEATRLAVEALTCQEGVRSACGPSSTGRSWAYRLCFINQVALRERHNKSVHRLVYHSHMKRREIFNLVKQRPIGRQLFLAQLEEGHHVGDMP